MKRIAVIISLFLASSFLLRLQLKEGPIAVPIMTIPADTWVGAIAWSPDGQFIAYSDLHNDMVVVWDIQNEEAIHTFQGEVYVVESLDWSDDGKYLAAAGNWTIVWDVTDGSTYPRPDLGEFAGAGGADWKPDSYILSYGFDIYMSGDGPEDAVRIWNLETQEITQIDAALVSNPIISWNPDGTHLAISDRERLQVWDMARPRVVSEISRLNRVKDFDWSTDGQMIALATQSGPPSRYMQIWGVFDSELIRGPYIENIRVQGLDWNPRFDVIAYIDDNNTVRLWDLYFNKIIFQEAASPGGSSQVTYAIGPVEWSNDGRFLATVDGTGNIVIWKVYL